MSKIQHSSLIIYICSTRIEEGGGGGAGVIFRSITQKIHSKRVKLFKNEWKSF